MKTVKKIFKVISIVIAIPIIVFIGIILYAIATDYKPAEEELIAKPENPSMLKDSLSISLLTWNIGYAGLDKNMDFFFDGGTKVITPEENCRLNIAGIELFLKNNDTIDFIVLQEVDIKSKRSNRINEYDSISKKLPHYNGFFAKNYDVFYVPTPPSNPMGNVLGGLVTYSKYIPVSSTRYSLPGDFGFPMQLFYMDRCFIANRYMVENGKELILINTHNEAFDETGEIRKAQMERLKEFMLNEYKLGNYIIVGGDWNQYPPDFKPAFKENKPYTIPVGRFHIMGIESDYMPEKWEWIYDNETPSLRTIFAPYDRATTPTTVSDVFLISPNIKSVYVKCQNLDFENADHNPVIIKVKLN